MMRMTIRTIANLNGVMLTFDSISRVLLSIMMKMTTSLGLVRNIQQEAKCLGIFLQLNYLLHTRPDMR